MKKTDSKTISFIRRNRMYLILALCILAVGLSIAYMMVNESNNNVLEQDPPEVNKPVEDPSGPVVNPDEQPSDPVDLPITFSMPIDSVTEIVSYSDTMVWNSTLNRYSTHMAMDFFAPEGSSVMAVYDGVVKSVESTLLEGVTIIIDHGDGLCTVYNSLADGDLVSVGQEVVKGQVIGQVSVSNRQEYKSGAHLHFEVLEDGKSVDPIKYLEMEEK